MSQADGDIGASLPAALRHQHRLVRLGLAVPLPNLIDQGVVRELGIRLAVDLQMRQVLDNHVNVGDREVPAPNDSSSAQRFGRVPFELLPPLALLRHLGLSPLCPSQWARRWAQALPRPHR